MSLHLRTLDHSLIVLTAFAATNFLHCGQPPQEEEDAGHEPPFQCEQSDCQCEENATCDPTDLFSLDHDSSYQPFSSSDAVNTQDDFGIYHDESESVGSIINFGYYELDFSDGSGGTGGAVSETYENTLSVMYDADSWMSIRRAFQEQADFCGCNGVAFDLYTIESTSHTLRFTLADLACTDALYEDGEDELWWSSTHNAFDIEAEWTTIRLPFESFDESHGYGTRHNDNELSLKCIQAFEFSITGGSGHFLIRNVRTYAD